MLKIEKHARGIHITEVRESAFKGQFIVEPLYRGYGHTLGMHYDEFCFLLFRELRLKESELKVF